MPGPLELWYSRVPALSAYAYQKASSSVLALWSGSPAHPQSLAASALSLAHFLRNARFVKS